MWSQGNFRATFKLLENVTQFFVVVVLLKNFYQLAKYWFSIYIIYLVGENTFHYDTESE